MDRMQAEFLAARIAWEAPAYVVLVIGRPGDRCVLQVTDTRDSRTVAVGSAADWDRFVALGELRARIGGPEDRTRPRLVG